MDGLLAYLRRTRRLTADPAADGELLARFAAAGDEAAFAEVVRRHGPTVYAACRRLLPDPADADDAFQAVFLVLVRRAGRLSGRASVGPWLYRTAVWTARNLRRRNARRLSRTRPLADDILAPLSSPADVPIDLDAALIALPERARAAVVLCHLEGLSRREAAARLGCPEGTLSAVLARSLVRLRARLGGAEPVAVLVAAGAGATLPAETAAAVVRAAGLFRTASLSAVGVSPAAADLTRGVLQMIWLKKMTTVGLAAAAVAGLGLGLAVVTVPGSGAVAQDPARPPVSFPKEDKEAKLLLDRELEVAKARLEHLQNKRAELDKPAAAQFPPTDPVVFVFLDGRPERASKIKLTEFVKSDGGTIREAAEIFCVRPSDVQTYLARARKDPAAPEKLVVLTDPAYPPDQARAVGDICQKAGFHTVQFGPLTHSLQPATKPDTPLAYIIEPPDVLRIEAVIRLPVFEASATPGSNPKPKLDPKTNRPIPSDQLQALPLQPIMGEYPVKPDGTVNLGLYGSVRVAGLTTDQAREAVQKHIGPQVFASDGGVRPEFLPVVLDIKQSNSKFYYVLTTGPAGEQAFQYPAVGSETVLDALSYVTKQDKTATVGEVVVYRKEAGGNKTLPVDWAGILRGQTDTNYRLQPGDRVYVRPKPSPLLLSPK